MQRNIIHITSNNFTNTATYGNKDSTYVYVTSKNFNFHTILTSKLSDFNIKDSRVKEHYRLLKHHHQHDHHQTITTNPRHFEIGNFGLVTHSFYHYRLFKTP